MPTDTFFATRTQVTRDDWQTPGYIVEALGQFDLDPCASINNPFRLASCGYPVGGLILPWHGRVWCNPPYGAAGASRNNVPREWIKRLAQHGNGIALIPPRVGSHWFQDEVLSTCDAVLFLRGRISFLDERLLPKEGCGNNADSVLIAWGAFNVAMLRFCGLPGKFWDMSR